MAKTGYFGLEKIIREYLSNNRLKPFKRISKEERNFLKVIDFTLFLIFKRFGAVPFKSTTFPLTLMPTLMPTNANINANKKEALKIEKAGRNLRLTFSICQRAIWHGGKCIKSVSCKPAKVNLYDFTVGSFN